MQRVNVFRYDGDGRHYDGWFDLDAAAEIIAEDTRWDGHNNVSVHAIGRWDHERLIRTRSGRWVLDHWSQMQGTEPCIRHLTDDQALEWLMINGSDDAVERYFGEQEERGPGRPAVGGTLEPTNLGDELLARVKAENALNGGSRAATVRALLTEALDARDKVRSNT